MTKTSSEAVVFVHGLWMRPWTWMSYRHFLQHHDYKTYAFGYKTTRQPFEFNVLRLAAFVNSRQEDVIHLVGHSMGGILALQALPKIIKPGKLLLIGTPVNGSKVAQRIKQLGFDKSLLKYATRPLTEGHKKTLINRQTLMIAGDAPYGLGHLITRWDSENDGTVAVSETQADWLDEHQTVHTSHMGLLNNAKAKQLTLEYLRHH